MKTQVLSIGAFVLVSAFTGSAFAQGAPAPKPAASPVDFSKVEIKTTKHTDSFYTLDGQGGRIGVLAGPDGVFMVDSQFAPLTEKIVAAIRQISDRPIRFLVDTHVHGDHTGGNANLGKMGVTIMAQENLRARLAQPNAPLTPTPAVGLPTITYDKPVSLYMNGEHVQLIPVPAAHTDGDTMVYFPNANVIMVGDFFRSVGYPNIDLANGGSLKGMLDGLNAVIALGKPDTKVIPGHGPIVDKSAVAAHRDMIVGVNRKVTELVKQKKTQEEVIAAKPTSDYDSKMSGLTQLTTDRFVGQLYAEASKGSER
jgi:glyoxylase-like metal-dependent hydrolase (beta-lactamase superfamily II)